MSASDWKVPAGSQPKPQLYGFDLERKLSAVMALSSTIPADAFTADTLGTERAGNAVLIRDDGLVLTIGYLVTEAQSVWLTLNDGRVVPGHVIGIDAESGLALVQALGRLNVPALTLGSAADTRSGDSVIIGGAGGRRKSIAGRIMMKQEFAGYWEYVLDEAIFTAPAHPHWGGTALIGSEGELLGIGSLHLQQEQAPDPDEHLNMIVPIDLLKPVLDDILRFGRPNRPARPWLGVFATEVEGRIAIAGVNPHGPAETAQVRVGDIVVEVAGRRVDSLAGFFRQVWAQGSAGSVIPMKIHRDGRFVDLAVPSTDRALLLKRPVMH